MRFQRQNAPRRRTTYTAVRRCYANRIDSRLYRDQVGGVFSALSPSSSCWRMMRRVRVMEMLWWSWAITAEANALLLTSRKREQNELCGFAAHHYGTISHKEIRPKQMVAPPSNQPKHTHTQTRGLAGMANSGRQPTPPKLGAYMSFMQKIVYTKRVQITV